MSFVGSKKSLVGTLPFADAVYFFLILSSVHVLNCDFIKIIDMSYFSAVKSLNRGLSFRKVFL